MMARQTLDGFIPSNGVGTGFSRRALEMLALHHSNLIFEPSCMTEDYENGFRVRRLGLKQKFIPIVLRHGRAIATREFFPRNFRTAVKQRSRWVTGITLQSWEFHSFRETLRHLYWFWRDRKGLPGNLLTPLTNLIFLYGLVTWSWAAETHHIWGLAREAAALAHTGSGGNWFSGACASGLALQALHTGIRIGCSWRIYGRRFAAAVPLRVVVGNYINFCAAVIAIADYTKARRHRRPLRWAKTEHAYPTRAALLNERKRLGEILVGSAWISARQLEEALSKKSASVRLGEHLVQQGVISESDLYSALALQNHLELGKPEDATVSLPVTRSLPAAVLRKWQVLPFRIAAGELYVAGSDVPGEEMRRDIRRFTSLEIRFQLVTPGEFRELAGRYIS